MADKPTIAEGIICFFGTATPSVIHTRVRFAMERVPARISNIDNRKDVFVMFPIIKQDRRELILIGDKSPDNHFDRRRVWPNETPTTNHGQSRESPNYKQ